MQKVSWLVNIPNVNQAMKNVKKIKIKIRVKQENKNQDTEQEQGATINIHPE